MEAIFVPLSLFAGALLAVQAGANTQLSKATGSPFAATTIQVSVAGLLLLALAAATGTLAAFGMLPRAPWWHAIGGTATAFYVAATIILFPRLGATVTTALYIGGQMLASIGLDNFGLLGVALQPFGIPAVAGTLLVLLGTVTIVIGQEGAARELSVSKLGWIVLALVAGAVLPVQGAINGLLRADVGAPFVVGTVNFIVATAAMLVVLLLADFVLRSSKPHLGGLGKMPWWGWLGAFCGATYVTTVFTAIPVIGAAATVGWTVAGQQIASVFVDRYGWFRLPVRPVSGMRLAGVALLLAGVVIIKAG